MKITHNGLLASLTLISLLCSASLAIAAPEPNATEQNIRIDDFEGTTYGDWKVTGNAFGTTPARGTLPRQNTVSGFMGYGLVNSYVGGDNSQGTLTSPGFTITKPYLAFLLGGGFRPAEACINLWVNGKLARTATGKSKNGWDKETLNPVYWDVRTLHGQKAYIEIKDAAKGSWGHISVDQIIQSDTPQGELITEKEIGYMTDLDTTTVYGETYRPQFHFTAKKGWLNDPNGLVFYKGEYHLFFQHNPDRENTNWAPMNWGHAVSKDLLHWEELPIALHALENKYMRYSGSAVIDWHNTSGFGNGTEPPMVLVHTLTGKGQALAYSNDLGRTCIDYDHNPTLKDGDRDPKVFWHEPTKHWIMALYDERPDGKSIVFYNSTDLKNWTELSSIPGFYECPDIFQLPVDGDSNHKKWVLLAADDHYMIGEFDGTKFIPETPKLRGDWGKNFYASQTWNDIPSEDGRVIQIAWMAGSSFPEMPFNQQMTFPSVLSLRTFPEGIRLCKVPIQELNKLYDKAYQWNDLTLKPGENPLADVKGDLFHIEAEIEPGDAQEVGFELRGQRVWYSVTDKKFHGLGDPADLTLLDNRLKIQLLLDRTSLETYVDGGRLSFSSCFLAPPSNHDISLSATGGNARIISLQIHSLHSVWPKP